MNRTGVWMVLAALTGGCSVDTTGKGSGSSDGDGSTSTMGSSSAEATTVDGTTDATTDTTTDATTDTTTTTTTSTSTSTSTSATTDGSTGTGSGSASLVVAEAPVADLGDVDIDGPLATQILTLSNEGTAGATGITAALPAPFAFTGGSYPGTGGDCGDALDPAEMCTMVVEIAPTTLGALASTLDLDFTDPDGTGSVSVDLTARGVGTTANLVINGGGENAGAPPPDWTEVNGIGWTTTTAFSRTGSRSITAGNVNFQNGSYRLEQAIDISEYADVVDNQGSLRVDFSAYARSFGNDNDPYRVRLETLDEVGGQTGNGQTQSDSSTNFQLQQLTRVVPVGTRTLRMELICQRQNGENCDAYFDDISLTLTFPAN